jgi:glycosyltransferase A (GT-A) superfamily protein (DUF2064 family)
MLVVAKAPVPGAVKTRLAADLGGGSEADLLAAELAAAALLDTLTACRATGARCRIALAGDLADAVRSDDLRDALRGWAVGAQRGATFGERLVAAHGDVPGPVVQVGMDTPQLTPDLLLGLAAGLTATDAALAPAADGGWWALALRSGRRASPLARVTMSRPTTYADTRRALVTAGLSVGPAPSLRDVDHLEDVHLVAAEAPATAFAQAADALLGSLAR